MLQVHQLSARPRLVVRNVPLVLRRTRAERTAWHADYMHAISLVLDNVELGSNNGLLWPNAAL
jgi:hypothetical protein